MILDEELAVRYALGRTETSLYPKRYSYEEIIKMGEMEEIDFSPRTLEKLGKLSRMIQFKLTSAKNQEYAYLLLLKEDVLKIKKFLETETVDFTEVPSKLHDYASSTVIKKIKELLNIEYDPPPINFVTELPGNQWMGRKGGGFAADKWQSERYGMPEGIFVHEVSLVKDSEILLIHELTHPAVEAFPNFVPWFDEGLCNLMAFMIYSETTGDLTFRRQMHIRQEFGDYYFSPGRLFRRPNNMFCSLLLLGGMDLVKLLMGYKREHPENVDWNLIPRLLQEGTDLKTFLEKVVRDPVEFHEPEITEKERRIISSVLAHNISHVLTPLALLLYRKILTRTPQPGEWRLEELTEENIDLKGVKEGISELRDRSLAWVFPDGHVEPYTGPVIGTSHFLEAGLVRAWARKYELRKWE